MQEITPENATEYLRQLDWLPPGVDVKVDWLAWGVSNVVLRIQPECGSPFVVKQSREQLRTKADWFSRIDRIWREVDTMRALFPLLPPGSVPKILFESRENYLFAMEAVDSRHVVWKGELLDGVADPAVALDAARILGAIHRETFHRLDLRETLGDREVFDQLRIDPFYRRIAQVHSDLQQPISFLIEETMSRQDCVVHADFSPKNLLIVRCPGSPLQLALVDYETGHVGDPAFDLGFFLSHLILKTVRRKSASEPYLLLLRTFWAEYRRQLADLGATEAFAPGRIDRRAIGHLGGCLLARIDGKSPIDYLPQVESQEFVRKFARDLFLLPPLTLEEAFDGLERQLTT